MGNATRCEGVMDFICEDYDIDVMTSDKAYTFFEGHSKITNLFRQLDIQRPLRFEFGSFLYYLSQLNFFFTRIFKNYFLQKEIIKKNNYDLLVFDSDYSFVLHRLFGAVKVVGINNAFEVVKYFSQNKQELKPEYFFSFLLELLDYFTCRLFLNYLFCPSVGWPRLSEFSDRRRFIVPLLVRERVLKDIKPSDGSVLFISSSSEVKSPLQEVFRTYQRRYTPKSEGQRFEKNNIASLQAASAIFCNSGQSSVAECLYLKKPAVLFPIPKHAEQWANARLAESAQIKIYTACELPALIAELQSGSRQEPHSGETMKKYRESREVFLKYFNALSKTEERVSP